MADAIDILQHVIVFGAIVDGARILVDVYGSDRNVCGSVRFDVEPHEHGPMFGLLDHWRRNGTPLTLIARDGTVVLQNDQAVFASQFG
jgi:hypothetical protein